MGFHPHLHYFSLFSTKNTKKTTPKLPFPPKTTKNNTKIAISTKNNEKKTNKTELGTRFLSRSKMCCRTGIQKGSAGSVPKYSRAWEAISKLCSQASPAGCFCSRKTGKTNTPLVVLVKNQHPAPCFGVPFSRKKRGKSREFLGGLGIRALKFRAFSGSEEIWIEVAQHNSIPLEHPP